MTVSKTVCMSEHQLRLADEGADRRREEGGGGGKPSAGGGAFGGHAQSWRCSCEVIILSYTGGYSIGKSSLPVKIPLRPPSWSSARVSGALLTLCPHL